VRAVTDTLVIAERSVRRILRAPDLLTAFTIQPIMFVLLFRYVFGGAIDTPQGDYADFLMPGIVCQTIAFGGFVTALSLTDDLNKGLIDRFRSLPMSRSAVVSGRVLADILTNVFVLALLVITGLVVGFTLDTNVLDFLAGAALILFFGYAFSWIFATLGMLVSSPEAANSLGFITVFPLTFVSSVFVPIDTFPSALESFAEVNPFTLAADALRHFWLGTPAESNVWATVIWSIGLLAVFVPLATMQYKRAAVSRA
jgi:ABC transporter DrrB family efflux protein